MLAMLLERELPLPQALDLAAEASRDVLVAQGCRRLAAMVREGHSPAHCLPSIPALPATLGTLVHWGQQSSTLAASFSAAADIYEARARTQLSLMRIILPTLAFLLVLGGMLFMLSATAGPLINLLRWLM
jgi:type II secretory pathway component PulF